MYIASLLIDLVFPKDSPFNDSTIMYDPPFCAICGVPFDHVEVLDFAALGEDEDYLKDFAYDSQLLSSDKSAWIGHFRILARSNPRGKFSGTSVSPEAGIYVSAPGNWSYDEDWFDNHHNWIGPTPDDELNHTATKYADFSVVHEHCMDILQKFFDCQARSPSPSSPKSVEELINAWFIREKDSTELSILTAAHGISGRLPSDWACRPNVEHSHLYFGARRFWTDPWDCVPGHEYLCADPIQKSESGALFSTCLTRRHPNSNRLFSSYAEQVKSSEDFLSSHRDLVHLPREIHDLIISHLSLKDALSFYSSSRGLSTICDGTFWRFHTIRLHGCWLWELRDPNSLSRDDNWKGLLQLLNKTRSQIQEGAEPYWRGTVVASKMDKTSGDRSPDSAALGEMALPLGLRNRQRIWMCLESLGTKADWEIMGQKYKSSKATQDGP